MAKSFVAFEAQGIKALINGIGKLEQNLVAELDQELQASSLTIARDAKRNVPKDTGSLSNAISSNKLGVMDYEDVAQKEYAPYVEFGTGALVDVPEGLEDYAIQFKGTGKRQVNLPARPFLFPAYEEERKKLIDRLKKVLLNNAKRGITVFMPGSSNITSTTTI